MNILHQTAADKAEMEKLRMELERRKNEINEVNNVFRFHEIHEFWVCVVYTNNQAKLSPDLFRAVMIFLTKPKRTESWIWFLAKPPPITADRENSGWDSWFRYSTARCKVHKDFFAVCWIGQKKNMKKNMKKKNRAQPFIFVRFFSLFFRRPKSCDKESHEHVFW